MCIYVLCLYIKKKNANTYDQSMSNLSWSSPWLFKPMEDDKSNKSEMLNKTLLFKKL